MECFYLEKKKLGKYLGLSRLSRLLYGIHELHYNINVYKKMESFFGFNFKVVVAWKWILLELKFSYENLSPSPTIIYHYQNDKKCFAVQKSIRVLKLLRVFSDMILFRFLKDRILFQSSVIGTSSGSSAIDSSFESLCFFLAWCFFVKTCYYFFLKQRLFYIIFPKRYSRLTISSLINSTKLIAKNMKK